MPQSKLYGHRWWSETKGSGHVTCDGVCNGRAVNEPNRGKARSLLILFL